MRGRPRKPREKREVREVKLNRFPGYFYQRHAPHTTLIWGRYPVGEGDNPGGVKASRCYGCRSQLKPPKLLMRHHSEPYELHFCLGCPHVLIKAKVPNVT